MKFSKQTKFFYLSLVLTAALAGCNGSPSSTSPTDVQSRDTAFAQLLSTSTGQNYSVVKTTTRNPDVSGNVYTYDQATTYAVFKNTSTGQYVAYNVSKYNPNTMTSLSQYTSVATGPHDVVTNLTQTSGTYWVNDPSYPGGGYDQTDYYYGNGTYTFESKRAFSKDLEKNIAQASKVDSSIIASALVSQYGFSEDRAKKVSTLTKQLSSIAGSRELTDDDKDIFLKSSVGTNAKELIEALKQDAQGSKASYENLVQKAAEMNGTTPEQSRQLIEDMSLSK